MAIIASGTISLQTIENEFGGTGSIGLNEYVSFIGKTATANQNVAFSDFYNTSAYVAGPTVLMTGPATYPAYNYQSSANDSEFDINIPTAEALRVRCDFLIYGNGNMGSWTQTQTSSTAIIPPANPSVLPISNIWVADANKPPDPTLYEYNFYKVPASVGMIYNVNVIAVYGTIHANGTTFSNMPSAASRLQYYITAQQFLPGANINIADYYLTIREKANPSNSKTTALHWYAQAAVIAYACLCIDTPIYVNGAMSTVGDIKVGDILVGSYFDGMIDESTPGWEDWTTTDVSNPQERLPSVVFAEHFETNTYRLINNIKVTHMHQFFAKDTTGTWGWIRAKDITIEHKLFNADVGEVAISIAETVNDTATFVKMDVEDTDTYYAGDDSVLMHNKIELPGQVIY